MSVTTDPAAAASLRRSSNYVASVLAGIPITPPPSRIRARAIPLERTMSDEGPPAVQPTYTTLMRDTDLLMELLNEPAPAAAANSLPALEKLPETPPTIDPAFEFVDADADLDELDAAAAAPPPPTFVPNRTVIDVVDSQSTASQEEPPSPASRVIASSVAPPPLRSPLVATPPPRLSAAAAAAAVATTDSDDDDDITVSDHKSQFPPNPLRAGSAVATATAPPPRTPPNAGITALSPTSATIREMEKRVASKQTHESVMADIYAAQRLSLAILAEVNMTYDDIRHMRSSTETIKFYGIPMTGFAGFALGTELYRLLHVWRFDCFQTDPSFTSNIIPHPLLYLFLKQTQRTYYGVALTTVTHADRWLPFVRMFNSARKLGWLDLNGALFNELPNSIDYSHCRILILRNLKPAEAARIVIPDDVRGVYVNVPGLSSAIVERILSLPRLRWLYLNCPGTSIPSTTIRISSANIKWYRVMLDSGSIESTNKSFTPERALDALEGIRESLWKPDEEAEKFVFSMSLFDIPGSLRALNRPSDYTRRCNQLIRRLMVEWPTSTFVLHTDVTTRVDEMMDLIVAGRIQHIRYTIKESITGDHWVYGAMRFRTLWEHKGPETVIVVDVHDDATVMIRLLRQLLESDRPIIHTYWVAEYLCIPAPGCALPVVVDPLPKRTHAHSDGGMLLWRAGAHRLGVQQTAGNYLDYVEASLSGLSPTLGERIPRGTDEMILDLYTHAFFVANPRLVKFAVHEHELASDALPPFLSRVKPKGFVEPEPIVLDIRKWRSGEPSKAVDVCREYNPSEPLSSGDEDEDDDDDDDDYKKPSKKKKTKKKLEGAPDKKRTRRTRTAAAAAAAEPVPDRKETKVTPGITTKYDSGVYVAESTLGKEVGLGLFARVPFAEDQIIIPYKGEVLTTEQKAERYDGDGKPPALYLMELRGGKFIDSRDPNLSSLGRYANSGRSLNNMYVAESGNLKAKRAIQSDEELFFGYGVGYKLPLLAESKGQLVAARRLRINDAIGQLEHQPLTSGEYMDQYGATGQTGPTPYVFQVDQDLYLDATDTSDSNIVKLLQLVDEDWNAYLQTDALLIATRDIPKGETIRVGRYVPIPLPDA